MQKGSPILLCALIFVSPFQSTLPAQTVKAASSTNKSLRTSQDLEADLLKERDRAEFNVNLAKRKLEKDTDALLMVKQSYVVAWRSTNLLIEDIQESIKSGKNPARSKLFNRRAGEAQKALEEFNSHVEKTLLPPDKQPKIIPVLLPIATSLVELIWNKMSEASKESAAERKIQREEMAKKLDDIKFKEFDQVPK